MERQEQLKIFPLSCGDVYHGECIKQYFVSRLSENKLPIICPEPKCKMEVNDDQLKLLLSEEQMNLYYERTFNKYADKNKDLAYCPTADCKFVFIFDD